MRSKPIKFVRDGLERVHLYAGHDLAMMPATAGDLIAAIEQNPQLRAEVTLALIGQGVAADPAHTELTAPPSKSEGEWEALLAAARGMLLALENKYPGLSREDSERAAHRRLKLAVDAFPHPCAAAPSPPKAPDAT